jgi:hypothetical protein
MLCKPHVHGPRYSCPACHQSINAVDADSTVERDVLADLDPQRWASLRRRGRGTKADTTAIEVRLAELAQRVAAGELTHAEWEILRPALIAQAAEMAREPLQLPNVADIRLAWPGLAVEAKQLVLSATTTSIVISPPSRRTNRFDETRIVTSAVD